MNRYLEKHSLFDRLIETEPMPGLGLIIVIPAFKEAHLTDTLTDLYQCARPGCPVEVIIVINHSEQASMDDKLIDKQVFNEASRWKEGLSSNDSLQFHILNMIDLPSKKAGVGLARKIGMDEAVRRFDRLNVQSGVIACYDADCRCDPGYLIQLVDYFKNNTDIEACSVYFKHPYESADHKQEIIEYELHLRYFIEAQRYAGFPYAFHTIGSSMAVRSSSYQKMGGMNTRQAGEDFYFLQKFIERGKFGELNRIAIYPSARISDRVPFGTGKAISDLVNKGGEMQTYQLAIFFELKKFLQLIPLLHNAGTTNLNFLLDHYVPASTRAFLMQSAFKSRLEEIHQNTSTLSSFTRRFYAWFNAFRLIKYVHFMRDHRYPNVSVAGASRQLLSLYDQENAMLDAEELLSVYRKIQRGMNGNSETNEEQA
jgi:hypothetical protein